MTAQQPLTYDAFAELAAADPAVVGLVLKGSRAHDGMTTRYSDHDLYVVLADDATTDLTRFAGHRTAQLDLVIISLSDFRAAGMPGFERYALARAHVLLDRLDGGIARMIADKARLETEEAFRNARDWLDAYANSLYRSLKNHRDGQTLAARLDAADSARFLLECSSPPTVAPAPTTNTWSGSFPGILCRAGTRTCCSVPWTTFRQRATRPCSGTCSLLSRRRPARPDMATYSTHGARTSTSCARNR